MHFFRSCLLSSLLFSPVLSPLIPSLLSSSLLFSPLRSSSLLFAPLRSSSLLFAPLISSHLLSSPLISSHLLSSPLSSPLFPPPISPTKVNYDSHMGHPKMRDFTFIQSRYLRTTIFQGSIMLVLPNIFDLRNQLREAMWETCCWKQHRPSIFLLVRHEWVTVSVQIAAASPHMMVGSMISSDFSTVEATNESTYSLSFWNSPICRLLSHISLYKLGLSMAMYIISPEGNFSSKGHRCLREAIWVTLDALKTPISS